MPPVSDLIFRALAILPALTFHEFAHAWTAWKFGDPTPKMQNRVSLNPLNHLTPIGTLMIMFGPIGWAKPVQVNPQNFRDPEKDFMLSTAAGPACNIAQAIIWAVVFRISHALNAFPPGDQTFAMFVITCVHVNFALALSNLVPLGPLDGHRILRYILPYDKKVKFEMFNQQYGMMTLFLLLIMSRSGGWSPLALLVFRPAQWLTYNFIGLGSLL